jgi:AraC-like DNA-binding protein
VFVVRRQEAMTAMPEIMTEIPEPSPFDEALERLRLSGAIFFRSEFTESWAYISPPAEDIARMLHPGVQRLIMFHIVAQGRCWVSVDDGVKHWADPGDVLVLPYGDQHSVGGSDDAVVTPIHSLFPEPPWATLPVLRYGLGGTRTDIVCGYLHSADPLFDPAIGALPRVFVVRLADTATARWVQASIDYAVAQSEASLPSAAAPTRLPEMLLTEVLRAHLASAPAIDHGWIAALHDPVLASALSKLHHAPAHHWSLTELAAAVSVSRSLLDERFRRALGRSPIRYLTEWRMHAAADLLRSTDFSVAKIAREVGYDSEEAFSRAFKRHHGRAPGQWRTRN